MSKLKKRYGSWLGVVTLALTACLMSGCLTSPQSPEARAELAPAAEKLFIGEGLLMVKVAGNRSRISPYFNQWETMWLWSEEKGRQFVLSNRADSSASHSLFVKSLPPGTYRVESIETARRGGPVEIVSRMPVRDEFPSFKIARGQLTDLGTMIVLREHDPVSSTRRMWAHMDSPLDRAAGVAQLGPIVAAALATRPTLGWNPDPRLATLQRRFEQVRGVSMLANGPARLADGSLLFGEAFGQIASRSPSGIWTRISTPTGSPIRSVYAGADGSLLAGSDEAILLRRRAGQSEWEKLPLPFNEASIVDIGPLPGSEALVLTLQTRDRFVVLSTSAAAPGEWTELYARPRELFSSQMLDTHVRVLRGSEHLFLVSGGPSSKAQVTRYDGMTRAWTTVTPDDAGLPTGLVPLPDGSLARFDGMPVSGGRYFRISSDAGAHWDKRAELRRSFGPVLFTSDSTGYVVINGPMSELDPVDPKAPPTVWRTEDAGHTWTEAGPAPAFPSSMISLGQPGHLAYISGDGRFFNSQDGGKSWSLEQLVP